MCVFISELPKRHRFPYLKTDGLTENQREELLTKLSDDFEAIKIKFCTLLHKISQSLKRNYVNPTDLCSLIKRYIPENHEIFKYLVTENNEFFDHNHHWSFFDYEFLALIIDNYCPELKGMLSDYITMFKSYCHRTISEIPTDFISVRGRHFVIRVKVGKEFSTFTMEEIKQLETGLRKILKINLSISTFEPGSIILVFVSLNEENNILPLSEEEKHELFELGVFQLYTDSHVYFDHNKYSQVSNLQSQETLRESTSTKYDTSYMKYCSKITTEIHSLSQTSQSSQEDTITSATTKGEQSHEDTTTSATTKEEHSHEDTATSGTTRGEYSHEDATTSAATRGEHSHEDTTTSATNKGEHSLEDTTTSATTKGEHSHEDTFSTTSPTSKSHEDMDTSATTKDEHIQSLEDMTTSDKSNKDNVIVSPHTKTVGEGSFIGELKIIST